MLLAAKGNLVDALTQFEPTSKLSRRAEARNPGAARGDVLGKRLLCGNHCQRSREPELANQQRDQSLPASLQANLQPDEAKARDMGGEINILGLFEAPYRRMLPRTLSKTFPPFGTSPTTH
jgi:hypothetical protein